MVLSLTAVTCRPGSGLQWGIGARPPITQWLARLYASWALSKAKRCLGSRAGCRWMCYICLIEARELEEALGSLLPGLIFASVARRLWCLMELGRSKRKP